jgi:hypothetical protein
MNPALRDHPVFICGHPKSGTSLLRSLLDSHPELLVYPEETVFFRRYLLKAQGKTLAEKLALADEYLLHMFTWNQAAPVPSQKDFPDRDYSDVPFSQVQKAFQELTSQGLRHDGDLLFNAMAAYGLVTGKLNDKTHRWVEKTPYNERFVEQILSWWPEALFIHVIRDPRDNYASYQRKHPEWGARAFARSWQESTLKGLEYQQKLDAEHYWVLRYEDFILQVETQIGKLCKYLGIQDHPTLRAPTRNGKPWGGNSMFGERFQGIDATPLGRWKQSLPAQDVLMTEWAAAEAMRRLDYPVSGLGLKDIPLTATPQLIKAWIATKVLASRRTDA